jgi:hypothetical protein
MIRNILTRVFSGESSPTSENKPANQTAAPAAPSYGISSIGDSFVTTASKGSPQNDLGLVPSPQTSTGAEKQKDLLQEQEKLREEEKKFEEMTKEAANNQDSGFFGAVGKFFGEDQGTMDLPTMDSPETQNYQNSYNDAENRARKISETVDDTSDDVKKHFG